MEKGAEPNSALDWDESMKNSILRDHHLKIIHIKFHWNRTSSFREEDLWIFPYSNSMEKGAEPNSAPDWDKPMKNSILKKPSPKDDSHRISLKSDQ